ncbi:hypothetical protein SAMN05661080_00080 [Modestobacter sp. DSM 44400]|uniref:hypothetical protein n=1 Tax=Modestobacter sp. DSM 44400 TaxID=1550230 RepID=UPI00089B7697|nr:hypothetical protein [Modestobacter sp. DSM 44400]SDX47891.1 hypothetical protein SAMN05661080_00080 [Modestobacter sp. DSM 44400]
MSSTDITMTGAAGAAPTPAVVVCPSPRGVVRTAPSSAAPLDGTGLPFAGTTTLRPRVPADALDITSTDSAGISFEQEIGVVVLDGYQGCNAHRTTSCTPGDLPPRDPLS